MANDDYESQKVQALQALNETLQKILLELQQIRGVQQSMQGMSLAGARR